MSFNKKKLEIKKAQPFVKWAGGKRSILPALVERTPKEYERYVEPFLGGGAVFFFLQPKESYLSDYNGRLIATYRAVRDEVESVINYLLEHQTRHNQNYFETARTALSMEKDPIKIAALLIYLNRSCFNGLYRVNKNGFFNVPLGSYKELNFDFSNLRRAASSLKGAIIEEGSFETVEIRKGDFFYLDPPYYNTFQQYTDEGFSENSQVRLAEYCKEIDKKGAMFMLSNSDNVYIRELYRGFGIEGVMATRSISAKVEKRGKENELIIRNYR